jgi:hypothetical protein
VSRSLPALLTLVWLLCSPAPSVSADPVLASDDVMSRIPEAADTLGFRARQVWTDARPVAMGAWIEHDGSSYVVGVEMTFITSRGIVDGLFEARGDDMPHIAMILREGSVAVSQRNSWEKGFGVLRKFRWNNLSDEWLDRCAVPRPVDMPADSSLHMHLEILRRVPVLVLRYSEADEVCSVDDSGIVVSMGEMSW